MHEALKVDLTEDLPKLKGPQLLIDRDSGP